MRSRVERNLIRIIKGVRSWLTVKILIWRLFDVRLLIKLVKSLFSSLSVSENILEKFKSISDSLAII